MANDTPTPLGEAIEKMRHHFIEVEGYVSGFVVDVLTAYDAEQKRKYNEEVDMSHDMAIKKELKDELELESALFRELMALLHRDGGQYLDKHGPTKAYHDAAAVYYVMRAEIEGKAKQDKDEEVCEWEYDDIDDKWHTPCGLSWIFTVDSTRPDRHDCYFCPRCGKKIKVKGG